MRHRDVAHRSVGGLALAVVTVLVCSACGGDDAVTSATVPTVPPPEVVDIAPATTVPTPPTLPSAPSSAARAPVTSLADPVVVVPSTDAAPPPVASGAVIATPTPGPDGVTDVPGNPDLDDWHESAVEHRDAVGNSFRYTCPPVASVDGFSVWGSGVYTDDSSVCAAAVHAGLIDPAAGGTARITITPGQDAYVASTAHGVASEAYATWPASFYFPDAAPVSSSADLGAESWLASVVTLGVGVGFTGTLECAPSGALGEVWGTGVYSGASSICTAAVHFGLIDTAAGGSVTFDVLGAQPEFIGSTARGVTTHDHATSGPAFQFSD